MAYKKPLGISFLRESERPPCLDAVVKLKDGTKHDGMGTPFSQLHLLIISAFTTVE